MRTYLAAAFLLSVITPSAPARQAAAVPHRHPLGRPVSASEARAEYQQTLRKVKALRAAAAPGQAGGPSEHEPFECPGVDGSVRRCVGGGRVHYYLGEYLPHTSNTPALVPALPDSTTREGGAAETGWAPAGEVAGGAAELGRLEDRMGQKSLDDCRAETGECKTVVEAVPAKEGERTLAVCDVARVGDKLGAVRNCEAVAVITPAARYLRAAVAYRPGQAPPAALDGWDGVAEYHIERGSPAAPMPGLAAAIGAVRAGLVSGGMGLEAEPLPGDSPARVVGAAGLRRSPILDGDGFLEKISLRAEAAPAEGEGGGLTLRAFFSVQLREDGERPEDFRQPTGGEVEAYKSSFDQSIRMHLLRLCERARWKDLTTLVCLSKYPDSPGQPPAPTP